MLKPDRSLLFQAGYEGNYRKGRIKKISLRLIDPTMHRQHSYNTRASHDDGLVARERDLYTLHTVMFSTVGD